MEIESFGNLEQLKKKYEYDEEDFFEYDTICTHLSAKCDCGVRQLIKKIKELIEKLRNYKGIKFGEREKYLKEMEKKLKYYENLKEKILSDNLYNLDLISSIHATYKTHLSVENIKQVCKNAIKNILDSRVKVFINYDKDIINLFDLIKQLNLFFNF